MAKPTMFRITHLEEQALGKWQSREVWIKTSAVKSVQTHKQESFLYRAGARTLVQCTGDTTYYVTEEVPQVLARIEGEER